MACDSDELSVRRRHGARRRGRSSRRRRRRVPQRPSARASRAIAGLCRADRRSGRHCVATATSGVAAPMAAAMSGRVLAAIHQTAIPSATTRTPTVDGIGSPSTPSIARTARNHAAATAGTTIVRRWSTRRRHVVGIGPSNSWAASSRLAGTAAAKAAAVYRATVVGTCRPCTRIIPPNTDAATTGTSSDHQRTSRTARRGQPAHVGDIGSRQDPKLLGLRAKRVAANSDDEADPDGGGTQWIATVARALRRRCRRCTPQPSRASTRIGVGNHRLIERRPAPIRPPRRRTRAASRLGVPLCRRPTRGAPTPAGSGRESRRPAGELGRPTTRGIQ